MLNKKIIIYIFNLVFITSLVYGGLISGSIVNSGGTITDLAYSSGANFYLDNADANDDVGLKICGEAGGDVASKYVMAVYGIGLDDATQFEYFRTTHNGIGAEFIQTGAATGNCAETGNDLMFFITQGDPDPHQGGSWFPGNLYIIVSSDQTVDNSDDFIFIGENNGVLEGYYNLEGSSSNYNYDQVSGEVLFDITSFRVNANDDPKPDNDNKDTIVMGVCNNANSTSCSDVGNTSIDSSDVMLDTGVISPSDQTKTEPYMIVNGIADQFCIGPDLYISSMGNDAGGNLLSGESANITVNVKNGGNVNVTTDFNVTVTESISGFENVTLITETIEPSQTVSFTINNVVPGPDSGPYTYTAQVQNVAAGIDHCTPSYVNPVGTTNMNVDNVITPQIWINELIEGNFTNAGMINNLTIQLTDSDSSPSTNFANWTVEIVETNGYSLLAPLQFNADNGFSGVSSESIATLVLDNNGAGSFTLSPANAFGLSGINESGEYGVVFPEGYSLGFNIFDSGETGQHILYQGVVYEYIDEDSLVPFGFDNSTLFEGNHTNLDNTSIDTWHTVTTPNGDRASVIWAKIRSIALELTNLINA